MNDFAAAENERSLSNVLRVGKVVELDPSKGLVRVDVAGQESGWINWAALRSGKTRVWSPPQVDEQILIGVPHGDMGQAVVLGSIYCEDFDQPADSDKLERVRFHDGTEITYDWEKHELTVKAPTATVHAECKSATIKAAERITCDTPLVRVNGDVEATGDVRAGGISLRNHRHGGVYSGGEMTGAPS